MKHTLVSLRSIAIWGVGPLITWLGAGGVGQWVASSGSGFFGLAELVTEERLQTLEAAPYAAMANAVWAFGNETSVRRVTQRELNRLGDSAGRERARAYLRFGMIDTNPDGQAAVFAQACLAEPAVCDNLAASAREQAQVRFVRPGNTVPLSLTGGHPPVTGHE